MNRIGQAVRLGDMSGNTSVQHPAPLKHSWPRTSRTALVTEDPLTGARTVTPDITEAKRMTLCTLEELQDLLLSKTGTKLRERLGRENAEITQVTGERLMIYLEQLEHCGTHMKAAELAELSYHAVRMLRRKIPELETLAQDAMERYREKLEHECRRRAVDGWDEPIIGGKDRDRVVAHVKRYDSRLMELMLKRHIPEYREKFEGTLQVHAGVLLVPSQILDAAAWQQKHSRIEGDEKDTKPSLPMIEGVASPSEPVPPQPSVGPAAAPSGPSEAAP